MGAILKNQLDALQERLLGRMKDISEQEADILLDGYNNNIRWNFGHFLTCTEKFLFGQDGKLPENYWGLFGPGTKPADWSGEVPSLALLIQQYQDQLKRINEIPNEKFQEPLAEVTLGKQTYGELAGFMIYHQSFHYGQIHAMKKVIDASLAKQQ